MSQIGDRARKYREALGVSQEAIARRAGIAMTTYNRIENGRNQPTLDTLRRLAGALEVSVDDLTGGPIEAAG